MTALRLSIFAAVLGLASFLFLPLAATPALAQLGGALDRSDGPLEIDAEEGIEWRRNEKQYIARGNARAASGALEVYGEVLIAHYRDSDAGGSEVYLLEAQGDVRIVTANEVVYGDYGRYSLDEEHMKLTGDDLRLESKNGRDQITAKESLEYFDSEKRAEARGDARAQHDDKTISADTIFAFFEPGQGSKLQVERVEAEGNVSVQTPTELAVGDTGVYYIEEELATLAGDVKITRDENQLNGEFAEVNLATGISRLTGGEGSKRVHGLVLPAAQKKGTKGDAGAAAGDAGDTQTNSVQDESTQETGTQDQ